MRKRNFFSPSVCTGGRSGWAEIGGMGEEEQRILTSSMGCSENKCVFEFLLEGTEKKILGT
jgi:hypothetical protein